MLAACDARGAVRPEATVAAKSRRKLAWITGRIHHSFLSSSDGGKSKSRGILLSVMRVTRRLPLFLNPLFFTLCLEDRYLNARY